jgi:glutamyl endopeptidase
MVELISVSKPQPQENALESMVAAPIPVRRVTRGCIGTASPELSRSLKHLVVKGKSGPLPRRNVSSALESIIGIDERTRILDTDLAPWRIICALHMQDVNGAGAIGTGWLVGPKTVITAGHCVFSNAFFGGWASLIEVNPGRNGDNFPYQTTTSVRFSSLNRWVEAEDPDFDIGCIHLNKPIGNTVGWFQVATLPADVLQGYLVNIAGYPGDRGAGAEQYHHRNRVLRVTERRLFYDVDTYGGQSGAPVWIHESEESPPVIVGIHAYGVGGTPQDWGIAANSAPRIIPEVLDRIEGWVNEDGGWPVS